MTWPPETEPALYESLPSETFEPGTTTQGRRGSAGSILGLPAPVPADWPARTAPPTPAHAGGEYRGAEAAPADAQAGPAPCALEPAAGLLPAAAGKLERQPQAGTTRAY